MKSRCHNPTHRRYREWGGRGITVCERWWSFANFYADMGKRPGAGYSLDRIDNDGNYEPGNVRWATAKEQANNRRKPQVYRVDSLESLKGAMGKLKSKAPVRLLPPKGKR